jgi:hypothetical protein
MAASQYRRSALCEAIQFNSPDQVQEIIDFVGLPVMVEYKTDGSVHLRVIRGTYEVAVACAGDYLVKHENGKIEAVKKDDFESQYEPVDSGSG